MYYSIKWRELPYEEVTLEPDPDNCQFEIPDYKKAVENYWNLKNLVEVESKAEKKTKDEKTKVKDKDKRKASKKLELNLYRLEGVNWLRYS
jgi:hypothetical protein